MTSYIIKKRVLYKKAKQLWLKINQYENFEVKVGSDLEIKMASKFSWNQVKTKQCMARKQQ